MILTSVGYLKKAGKKSSYLSEEHCSEKPRPATLLASSSLPRISSGCQTSHHHPLCRMMKKVTGCTVHVLLLVITLLFPLEVKAQIHVKLIMPIFESRNPRTNQAAEYLAHQDEFRFSLARNTGLWGGWRSGKSVGGLGFCEVSMACNPGCKGAIIEPDYKMLEEFLEDKFKPAFKHLIVGERKTHNLYRIFMRNGITVYGLSGHNLDKLEQWELAWLFADEAGLMKRDLFLKANARVNDPNAGRQRIGYAGTPRVGWCSEIFSERDDEQRKTIHVNTEANPHLTAEFIKGLYAACPARLKASMIGGQFTAAGGSVYAEFDPDVHGIPWHCWTPSMNAGLVGDVEMVDGSYSKPVVNVAIDWAPRRPHVLWIQRVPKYTAMPGGWHTTREVSIVVDEVYPDGRHKSITVQRLCNIIKKRCPPGSQKPWPVSEAVVDPAGVAAEATSGESEIIQAKKFLNLPIMYRHGERVKVGVQHVQLALEPAIGHPFLFFSNALDSNPDPCAGHGNPDDNKERAVKKAMQGYAYPEEKDGKVDDEPHHDHVFSHAADCVRYHERFYYPIDTQSIDTWSAA